MARPVLIYWLLPAVLGGLVGSLVADEAEVHDYAPREVEALELAFQTLGITEADLRYQRDVALPRDAFPYNRELLADPLRLSPELRDLAEPMVHGEGDRLRLAMGTLAARVGWGRLGAFQAPELIGASPTYLVKALSFLLHPQPPQPPQQTLELLAAQLPLLLLDRPLGPDAAQAADGVKEEDLLRLLHDEALDLPRDLARHSRFLTGLLPWIRGLPAAAFPSDVPFIIGRGGARIGLGTLGDDHYEGGFAILIDPGGDDLYTDCELGFASGIQDRPTALFVDLGGDDIYRCGSNAGLGAASFGVAAFYDLGGGDDLYQAGDLSLGAALVGVATFYDDGGRDLYQSGVFTQGAAAYGLGIFLDDAPEPVAGDFPEGGADPQAEQNDQMIAEAMGQAFASTQGVALALNRRGHDTWQLGGTYLHSPLYVDRHQAYGQGFALGPREHNLAGGIALLVDGQGNDGYLGDVFGQGVGYYYGMGMLYDGEGHDTYAMTHYGQGVGVHLAAGILYDGGGDDSYVLHEGLGQGSAHDLAVGMLHDAGGDDRYVATSTGAGSGLSNGVGICLDGGGDDIYAGRNATGINWGRPSRGRSSVGLLVDAGGDDAYLGPQADGLAWRWSEKAGGADLPGGAVSGEDVEAQDALPPPALTSKKGPLTSAERDQLWALAIEWEVGANRLVVPAARARLIEEGLAIVPPLIEWMKADSGTLSVRGASAIFEGLDTRLRRGRLSADLAGAIQAPDPTLRTSGLRVASRLGWPQLGEAVATRLQAPEDEERRRAARVLLQVGHVEGAAALHSWLKPGAEEADLLAALPTTLALSPPPWERLRPLAEHALPTVRDTLSRGLANMLPAYISPLLSTFQGSETPPRTHRTLLDALLYHGAPLPEPLLSALAPLLVHPDAGVRGDALMVLLRESPTRLDEPTRSAVEAAKNDPHPYLRWVASQPLGD